MAHVNPRTAGRSNSGWIETKVLSSPVSSVQFANLSGNQASIFTIRGYITCETVETGVMLLSLSLNSDTSGTNGVDGNYRDFVVQLDAVPDGTTAADQNEFQIGTSLLVTQSYMLNIEIFSRSGFASGHVIKAETHNGANATTPTAIVTGSWDVTDEITSIELFPGGGATFDDCTFTGRLELGFVG